MKKLLVLLVGLVGLAVATSGVGQAKPTKAAAPAASQIACSGAAIGIMGPFTGPAASIGQEQLKWGLYAAFLNNKAKGATKIKLMQFDTQLDAAQAATRAVQVASNGKILAVVGPAGSQEVLSVANTYKSKSIGYISGSATRTSLTIGTDKISTFFRTVGNDNAQGATDAAFIKNDLKATRVFIIDDQSAYSVPLADRAESLLKAGGATVTRESVNQTTTDFSSLIAKIPSNTQVIFLPWQLAPRAQTFYQQARQQGKTATMLGSDGLDASEWISTANGQYFSSFAPDVKKIKTAYVKGLVAGYLKKYGDFKSTFGPPTFVAVQVAAAAIHAACKDGKATRGEVLGQLRKVNIKTTVLGYGIKFKGGDPASAKFYLFKINNGTPVFVK
jgi:branched-chain amino acid transport system substrate-binding protein